VVFYERSRKALGISPLNLYHNPNRNTVNGVPRHTAAVCPTSTLPTRQPIRKGADTTVIGLHAKAAKRDTGIRQMKIMNEIHFQVIYFLISIRSLLQILIVNQVQIFNFQEKFKMQHNAMIIRIIKTSLHLLVCGATAITDGRLAS